MSLITTPVPLVSSRPPYIFGVWHPFFPRILVHLVGLGLIVRQRRAVCGGQGAGLDRVPQPQQMLAADPHLTASFAVGTPCAMPRRIKRICLGLRWVPCQGCR